MEFINKSARTLHGDNTLFCQVTFTPNIVNEHCHPTHVGCIKHHYLRGKEPVEKLNDGPLILD